MWRDYCTAHPEAAQFDKKPLLFFAELDLMFSGSTATGRYSSASSAKVSAFQVHSLEGEDADEEEEDQWSLPRVDSFSEEAVSIKDILCVVHGFGVGGDNLGPVPLSMAALDNGSVLLDPVLPNRDLTCQNDLHVRIQFFETLDDGSLSC